MSHHVRSLIPHAAGSLAIDVECRISNGLPAVVIVGGANRTVNEARERLRGAFTASRLRLPARRVSLNLAPADMAKDSSGLDLALAVAILQADGRLPDAPRADEAFLGELGLDGQLRPVKGIVGLLLGGRARGIRRFYIAPANYEQAVLVPHVELVAPATLRQLYEHLNGLALLPDRSAARQRPRAIAAADPLADIAGHEQAKRALTVAAAGGHSLLLCGPPGTGKTMLAHALPDLLPPLSHDELLEVTHLHSLAASRTGALSSKRPLRAPHHSASLGSLLGGTAGRPGELSLSHCGVLLFDELPEFRREALEALRQPLEDRRLHLLRDGLAVDYPADFMFVATANLCPCGYAGHTDGPACTCLPAQLGRYRRKLSGPLLDRIDLCVYVASTPLDGLLDAAATPLPAPRPDRQVARAWRLQRIRYGGRRLNRDLSARQLARLAGLSPEARRLLDGAAAGLGLSARGYLRTVKVARTVADLDDSRHIEVAHLGEALRYRPQAVLPASPGSQLPTPA